MLPPVRSQRVSSAIDAERRAGDAKAGAVRAESQVAVRSCVGTREVLAIKVNGERQGDKGIAVVGVIADVVHSRHETSFARSEVICANSALGNRWGPPSGVAEVMGTRGRRRAFANQGGRRARSRGYGFCIIRGHFWTGDGSLGCVSLRQRERDHTDSEK